MNSDTRRIVCGTDFSIHAAEAANVAAAIAKRLDETLLLIHVQEHGGLGASHPEVLGAALDRTRERLDKEAERLRKLGAIVKQELLTGSPYEALVKRADHSSTRIVVVSSLGRIAPSRFLVGSVAERTAESATAPTLIVKDAKPFISWAAGRKSLKIVVGDDFSATSLAALRWVRELQNIGSCKVTVLHLDWPPAERQRLGVDAPSVLIENPAGVQRVLERDLKDRVAGVFGQGEAQVRVEPGWGRVDEHLIAAAQTQAADLIVVGTHQRQGLGRVWFGSISRGVLRHAPMNVAVIPMPRSDEKQGETVPEFKRVLATTDFSELGNRAVPYAYAVLRRGGTVRLTHVIPPRRVPGPLMPLYEPKRLTQKQHEQLAADSLKKLRLLIPPEAEALGIATEFELVEGRNVAKALCQEAERFGADLICIGSHGHSGLSKAMLGSVAQEVMTQSPRPVLVIRPPAL